MLRALLRFSVALVTLGGSDADDQIIVLPAPAKVSGKTGLLVWVPGGLVPNTFYVPLMKKLQTHLMGKIDLWVSIASCPNLLCFPGMNDPVYDATKAGRNASGVTVPKFTWLGGHSLGGEQADNACVADNGTTFGGCALWGSFIYSGPTGMLAYPVPVLSVVPELDFGSARMSKMAPYWSAANGKGAAQMFRTPVIVLPDVDHSDMCEGFRVPGDLPSASPDLKAIDTITMATASFMLAHILQDATATALMQSHIEFTRPLMEPLTEALALDLRSAKWCEAVALKLAGSFAPKVSIVGSYYSGYDSGPWPAPTANRSQNGTVTISVTGRNVYESDGGLWPPGAVPTTAKASLSTQLGAPLPMRDTALSMGCRLVSATKIASLLGAKVQEPQNFCHAANVAAWEWALSHAPERVLKRYHSNRPCNNCSRGIPVVFNNDTTAGGDFVNLTLNYNMSAVSLVVESPAYVTLEEHSCMLLSPARALDFLYLDAYSASIYPDSQRSVASSTLLV